MNEPNVERAVPFFFVSDMQRSLLWYVDGLGFTMTKQWIDQGQLRWCWLEHGKAALMLQEWHPSRGPKGEVGEGVSVCFICRDALAIYREVTERGTQAEEPFVGNAMWVTSLTDPDGYRLFFESDTDVPEETKLSEWESRKEISGRE
jgi:hypothetical protein